MFDHHPAGAARRFDRRQFLSWASSRGVALGVGGAALLAACGDDDDAANPSSGGGGTTTTTLAEANEQAEAVVGDVVDFALTSDDWAGDFGFVTMAIHPGTFDGNDVWFVRTDTSDADYAASEQLVHVPKLGPLSGDGLSGNAYIVEDAGDDQPIVFSSEPGRNDYTPAWTLHRVTWTSDPRPLESERDVLDAEAAGAATVERTDIVFNAGIIKWSSGEMAVDTVREAYLGDGQLLEPVDTTERQAMFKLSQCYPASRYFVLDHSVAPAAEMTHTVASPGLHDGPTGAGATGRTNVFMNGVEGPGPMGFQPSAFDFDAGDPAWSPYWDHWTYAWKDDATPRLLRSQSEIFEARDDGELDEFPGTPDMGAVFTVNCPVPVLAPPTFEAGV